MSTAINTITDLYQQYGHAHYGEGISQIEHAVQCATLAQHDNASAALVVATLLHDIGHLLEEIDQQHGNFKHDQVGADYLAPIFGLAVSEPVRLHAQAKRYLCSKESDYHDLLSEASKYSLQKQGGLMNADEMHIFEQNPYCNDAIRLRRWDDGGKIEGLEVQEFASFKILMEALI